MECQECLKENKLLFVVYDLETEEEYVICEKCILTAPYGNGVTRDTILGIAVAVGDKHK